MSLYKEVEGGKETPIERLKNKLSGIFICFDILAAGKKTKHTNSIKKDITEVSELLNDLENCCEC